MCDCDLAKVARFREWQREHLRPDHWIADPGAADPPRLSGDLGCLVTHSGDRDFRGADLRQVRARRAAFRDLDLRGACFAGVDLLASSFDNCDLLDADFRVADLREARFSGSCGLSGESFGGAQLQGATLPPEASRFDELAGIGEISGYIQRIFQFLLILCGFAILTILSIKDEDLILLSDPSMTSLPVLNASITPITFAFVVPGLILLIYLYQSIYTVSLWKLLSYLPAHFPDGTPLDRRAHPTVLTTFIRFHLTKVSNEPYDIFQCLLRGLIGFGLPPVTLALSWVCCLRAHNLKLSAFQSLLVGLSLGILVFIFNIAGPILKGDWSSPREQAGHGLRRDLRRLWAFVMKPGRAKAGPIAALIATLAMVLLVPALPGLFLAAATVVLVGLSFFQDPSREAPNRRSRLARRVKAIPLSSLLIAHVALTSLTMGSLAAHAFSSVNPTLKPIRLGKGRVFPATSGVVDPDNNLGRVLSAVGLPPFIDIRSRVVSHRPSSWTGKASTEGNEILSVSGADLEALDLRSMEAERAFLAKANLRRAQLQGAYLRFANLREADLMFADLRGAYLRGANLRDANLQGANLTSAVLSVDEDDPTRKIGANIQGAKLNFLTSFDEMDFIESGVNNVALAYFGETRVHERDHNSTKMRKGELERKRKWLEGQGVPLITDEQLNVGRLLNKTFAGLSMQGADFSGFDLTGSTFTPGHDRGMDLSSALFNGADLTDVRFIDVDLQGADFSKSILNRTTFERCKLGGATFGDAKVLDPRGLDALTRQVLGIKDPQSKD